MPDYLQIHGFVLRITNVESGVGSGTRFTLAGNGLDIASAPRQVHWIELNTSDLQSMTHFSSLSPTVQGRLDDGRFIEVDIGDPICSPDAVTDGPSRFRVLSLRCFEYRPAGWGAPAWLFSLLNFKLGSNHRSGLHATTEFRKDGSVAWYRDTTSFTYANRKWFLTDLLDEKSDKHIRDFSEHWTPICSAELWTEQNSDDELRAVELLARDIANLLSLATGRCVRWMDCNQLDACEQSLSRSRHTIWATGAREGGNGPIDTGAPHAFQAFMNVACAKIEDDPEWWARTLELHLQGTLSPIIDVRLIFYYMLLDRVSEKLNGTEWPKQIDPAIDAHLKDVEWNSSFHSVLQRLTHKWDHHRTETLVHRIREINSKPPYADRISAATTLLGLPKPDVKLLQYRHVVLHSGNLPSKLPKDFSHVGDLSRAIQALISAILLRMLDHAGETYLPDAGRSYLQLHSWPKDRPCPWSTR